MIFFGFIDFAELLMWPEFIFVDLTFMNMEYMPNTFVGLSASSRNGTVETPFYMAVSVPFLVVHYAVCSPEVEAIVDTVR